MSSFGASNFSTHLLPPSTALIESCRSQETYFGNGSPPLANISLLDNYPSTLHAAFTLASRISFHSSPHSSGTKCLVFLPLRRTARVGRVSRHRFH